MKSSTIYILIFFLGFFLLVYTHEQSHVAIYQSYGIESHIEYLSDFPNAVTIAEDSCPNESCRQQHSFNDIIMYPLMLFYSLFGLSVLIFILLFEQMIKIYLEDKE